MAATETCPDCGTVLATPTFRILGHIPGGFACLEMQRDALQAALTQSVKILTASRKHIVEVLDPGVKLFSTGVLVRFIDNALVTAEAAQPHA